MHESSLRKLLGLGTFLFEISMEIYAEREFSSSPAPLSATAAPMALVLEYIL